ncbi:hypothetical protein GCM10029964_035770 [Kibdelosporangium lantanae]
MPETHTDTAQLGDQHQGQDHAGDDHSHDAPVDTHDPVLEQAMNFHDDPNAHHPVPDPGHPDLDPGHDAVTGH